MVFICYISLASPARFIFQFKQFAPNNRPIIYITHPVKVDWTCGEVPWDFKDDKSNNTSVRVPPNKVALHHP